MHRVLQHIDDHLDAQLELDSLAAVANFSPFHFHRLFTACMGETVGDYTRRRRLEMAAQRMVAQPRVPVTQVALSVGFGSSEAFARAFKARFGSSPTGWRDAELSKQYQVNRKLDQAAAPGSPKRWTHESHVSNASRPASPTCVTRGLTASRFRTSGWRGSIRGCRRTTCTDGRDSASATTTRASRRPTSCATTPRSRCRPDSAAPASTGWASSPVGVRRRPVQGQRPRDRRGVDVDAAQLAA